MRGILHFASPYLKREKLLFAIIGCTVLSYVSILHFFYRFSVTVVAGGSILSACRWIQHNFKMQRLLTGFAVCVKNSFTYRTCSSLCEFFFYVPPFSLFVCEAGGGIRRMFAFHNVLFWLPFSLTLKILTKHVLWLIQNPADRCCWSAHE